MASPAIGTGTGEVQTNTTGNGVSTITINTPTNAITGDPLILVVSTGANRTITPVSGIWTQIGSTINQSVVGGSLAVFRGLHDGASGSYVTDYSTNTYSVGGIARVTGANTASLVDVSATFDSGASSSTTNSAPDVTTTVADTLLLNFYRAGPTVTQSTYIPASSQTEVFDINAGSTTLSLEMTKLDVASAGATGVKNSTASASNFWLSASVAIKPAVATSQLVMMP